MKRASRLSAPVLLFVVLAGLLAGVAGGVFLTVGLDLPQIDKLEDFEPSAVTRVVSSDGRLLDELYVQKRFPLELDQIPTALQEAVVAVEDRRFYGHPGMDVIRNFGALWADIRAGGFVEGASTITQQLARNLFLTSEKTLRRKLKEIFLALGIERHYTKPEILKMYLNQIYFGAGTYGVSAASRVYFGKSASELTLGQCALLAGLPKSPENYNPFKHPGRAKARRRVVLRVMVRDEMITEAQAEAAAAEPLGLAEPRPSPVSESGYLDRVRAWLTERYGDNRVYKGGLTVTATLNAQWQAAARAALEKRPGSAGPSALVVLESGTGRVLVWAESDPGGDPAGLVDQPIMAPGDAFQPIVYGAALENGFTQADLVWDAPIDLDPPGSRWGPYRPEGGYLGEITLRRALELGADIPAVKLARQIGPDQCLSLAKQLGINSPLGRQTNPALGLDPVPLLELTAAYNALPGGGLAAAPLVVDQVRDRTGRVLFEAYPRRRPALSDETAFILTNMLEGAVKYGAASGLDFSHPAAGMPGRSPDGDGAVFVGYTTRFTAGALVIGAGAEPDNPALAVWDGFADRVAANVPAAGFTRPPGVHFSLMNRYTGRVTTADRDDAVMAAFADGTGPKQP